MLHKLLKKKLCIYIGQIIEKKTLYQCWTSYRKINFISMLEKLWKNKLCIPCKFFHDHIDALLKRVFDHAR